MNFNFPPLDDPSMKHFWSCSGYYYRGHRKVNEGDLEVPSQPPTLCHIWTGVDWKLDLDKFFTLLRKERDFLLRESDKYMLEDFPISKEKKEEWKNYRQLLRDLPETIDPENPVWPSSPED